MNKSLKRMNYFLLILKQKSSFTYVLFQRLLIKMKFKMMEKAKQHEEKKPKKIRKQYMSTHSQTENHYKITNLKAIICMPRV